MKQKSKVLVLGAGLVAGPLVRYLAKQGYEVTVASRTVSKAEALVEGLETANAIGADITHSGTLQKLIPEHDLAISLVPHTHHIIVAEVCLEAERHMLTTSYIKPEIAAMEEKVQAAGLTFLNEIGLDPGIDHMSAMQVIDRVKSQGGKVVGFSSNCGGLPAPEAADNPLGYKLSWSPRGVVLAARNNGRYLENGKIVDVNWRDLFAQHWPMTVEGLGDFEFYTNRDCLGYVDLYGLQGVKDMFRGTIRNLGWCALWKRIVDLGYLDLDEREGLDRMTYAQLTASMIGGRGAGLTESLASFLRVGIDDEIIKKMQWLGLLSEQRIPQGTRTQMDALVALMMGKLDYKPGERDMIILQHRFTTRYDDREEVILSTLVDYGIPNGDSSMSRTVGLPAAIGADLILQGKIEKRGVLAPTSKQIYEPVLAKLDEQGIRFEEKALN